MKRLATRMKTLRESRGMTFEDLAEASGLSRRGVVSLERGERAGTISSWYRVARGLRVSMADLMAALD